MKKILTLVGFIFVFNQLQSQNYYFVNGKAQYWEDDSTSINIIVNNMDNYDMIVERLQLLFSNPKDEIFADNEDDNIIIK